MRKRGHSKEVRDNQPQVIIALAVTRDARRHSELAARREARQIDETLFFETCSVSVASEAKAVIRRRR
jgi:hypothetical protein